MLKTAMPVCGRPVDLRMTLAGPMDDYLHGSTCQWLLVAPDANPAMLEMLRDRDRLPYRNMVPWAGEFAGKYLTGAVQVLRVTGDPELRAYVSAFVEELLALQADDGYLGPWPLRARLKNHVVYPQMGGSSQRTWDSWGHYHIMLGLLLWYEDTGDARTLDAVRRMGDLLCEKYLGNVTPRLVETGCTEMNLAPAHSLCLLYRHVQDVRYLQLARQLVDEEFAAKGPDGAWLAGNWYRGSLEGQEFFELPRPRWEALHPIMALAELYTLTGEESYRAALLRVWHSIAHLDRHNNGGFSSGEQAQGNPYHQGAIETCCTIAWTALSVEVLRLTGDPLVADELELTLWNSIIGMHSVTGRWATYNTPMDGVRRASAHDIVFQAREGSPELNCCSVNSARGFGMLSDWALMRDDDGLCLNYYGPGTFTSGGVTLALETAYPRDGTVRIRIQDLQTPTTLKLRIPRWSVQTIVTVNGALIAGVTPGRYLALPAPLAAGDTIELALDMRIHAWVGEKESAGQTSLYRGPLLLAYDRRFNTMDPEAVPVIDGASLEPVLADWPGRLPPLVLLAVPTGAETLYLCDFGSAGEGGTPYRSWLPVEHAASLPQYFAPDPLVMLRADLIHLAQATMDPAVAAERLREHPADTPIVWIDEGLLAIDTFIETRDAICRQAASRPEEDVTQRALATLHRLETFDVADARVQLQAMAAEWAAAHPATPIVLTRYSATSLQPIQGPVAEVPLPPAIGDAPRVPFVAATELADVRGMHCGHNGLIYLHTQLAMPVAGPGRLLFGADGPVKVWVNEEPVACIPDAHVPAVIGEYEAAVHWREGENTVIFALYTDGGKAWGIVARAVRDTVNA